VMWCPLRFPHKTINVREYRRDNQKWTTGNIRYIRRRKSKQKHNTICVWHHYAQTHTNNVRKTWVLIQATGGMFDSTSHPVVCRRAHVLMVFLCMFAYSDVQYFVLSCVYVLSTILWWPLRFQHKTIFGWYLHPAVRSMADVLFTLFVFVCV
jgi:hypothetical protein